MARLDDFHIHPSTLDLVNQMVHDGELKYLVPERVWQELSRGLLEIKPSKMLDVLVQTHASSFVFPKGLDQTHNLSLTKEYLDKGIKLNLDLQIQLAYFLSQVDLQVLEEWTIQWKIPTDLRNFANAFHHFYTVIQKPSLNAEEVFQLFNIVDAWRKPDRLDKIFAAAQLLGFQMEPWQLALQAAMSVDAGLIARNLQTKDGSEIQATVATSRLQAIAACW